LGEPRWFSDGCRNQVGYLKIVGELCSCAKALVAVHKPQIKTARVAVVGKAAALRRGQAIRRPLPDQADIGQEFG
jgi:hypothetical protein